MTESIDDILGGDDAAYVPVVTARIPKVRQSLRDEHAELNAKLLTLNSDTIDLHPEMRPTLARIAEIEAEFEASMVEFRFAGIGNLAWVKLVAAHPPTRDQLKANPKADHNEDTFPYAAIEASCVSPKMTADQARDLRSKPWVDAAAWAELWAACFRANVKQDPPKSMWAAGLTRLLRGESVEQPTISESPSPSSSDE